MTEQTHAVLGAPDETGFLERFENGNEVTRRRPHLIHRAHDLIDHHAVGAPVFDGRDDPVPEGDGGQRLAAHGIDHGRPPRAQQRPVAFVMEHFTPENPVVSPRGAVVTNIAHIPQALTAVMQANAARPDFEPEGSLALAYRDIARRSAARLSLQRRQAGQPLVAIVED